MTIKKSSCDWKLDNGLISDYIDQMPKVNSGY